MLLFAVANLQKAAAVCSNPAGFYCSGTTDTACPDGYYTLSGEGAQGYCNPCPAGKLLLCEPSRIFVHCHHLGNSLFGHSVVPRRRLRLLRLPRWLLLHQPVHLPRPLRRRLLLHCRRLGLHPLPRWLQLRHSRLHPCRLLLWQVFFGRRSILHQLPRRLLLPNHYSGATRVWTWILHWISSNIMR